MPIYLLKEKVGFSKFGRGSLDDHLCQSTVKYVHLVSVEKIFKELICIIIGKTALPP